MHRTAAPKRKQRTYACLRHSGTFLYETGPTWKQISPLDRNIELLGTRYSKTLAFAHGQTCYIEAYCFMPIVYSAIIIEHGSVPGGFMSTIRILYYGQIFKIKVTAKGCMLLYHFFSIGEIFHETFHKSHVRQS